MGQPAELVVDSASELLGAVPSSDCTDPSRGSRVAVTVARTLVWMVPALAIVALTYLLPLVPLDGPLALAAYFIAESAGKYGATILCIALTVLIVWRPGIGPRQRAREATVLVVVLALANGGAAYFHEHVLKPALRTPRPNLQAMVAEGRIPITAEAFYALGEKPDRTVYLEERLPIGTLGMHELIRRHWLVETGYSFPSGHSLSAMTIATFFLAWGLSSLRGWRRQITFALVPWAVLVCYSRPILRVHSPTDVLTGASEGVVVGLAAYAVCRGLLRERRTRQVSNAQPAAAQAAE